ncbi:CPBP family glutamic-type intramembrane protease [Rhodoflexus sp.]
MSLSINQINWTEISVFYTIAVLSSAPFRLGLISFEDLISLPYGLNVFFRAFRGIGPFIGYLVVFYIINSKVKKEITFLGEKDIISFLSISPILIGLAVVGVENKENINTHFFGFTTGFTLIIYALFEEYGWRGYLQQALKPIKLPVRIFTIGTLWYIWHLNFLNPNITIQIHLIHYFSLLAGAWGLLKISEATSSLLFVSAVHLTFNILMDVNCAILEKIGIVITSVITWICLILYLTRKKI